jgi:hypothetical protein
VFCDFGYSQDYIDKYNNIINNCQNSLIELNTETLTNKMTHNKGRIDEIKSKLQDVSDIDINSHIQELHRNKSSELKPDFDTANEKYLRTIQNQNKSFKVRTFKERKYLEIIQMKNVIIVRLLILIQILTVHVILIHILVILILIKMVLIIILIP